MNTGSRIIGTKEEISYDSVAEFFEQRGNRQFKHKYNYVLYLDDTPEVAIQRDKAVKELLGQKLRIEAGMTVLDLGCGIGRWGEWFCPKGVWYVGIDGNAKMIERAKGNLAAHNNKQLFVCDVRDTQGLLDVVRGGGNTTYDIMLVYGLLMYLNDDAVKGVLSAIGRLCNERSQVCFVESMSNDERLTLKDIYSSELKQTYSAIYRTVAEFKQFMTEAFVGKLSLASDNLLDFADGMQKKREHVTMEHCMVWKVT